MIIYLDNAATTKPDKDCLAIANEYLGEKFYNPSALYAEGYNLQREIREIKEKTIALIADNEKFDMIFTASGTEADNLALFGGCRRGNLVTTEGEHSAVYSCAKELKRRGIETAFARLNSDGSVNVDDLLSKVNEKTSLVSVMHVNNETGAINDINAIAAKVKAKNPFALFHSDGVQSFGKIPTKLTENIDAYSVSAHKIGGVRGCGALIIKKSAALMPLIYGGGQENGLVSGTENVFAIKCFASASRKRHENITENYSRVSELNSTMRNLLDGKLFKIISSRESSPYILTVAAYGVRGEIIMHEADDRGLVIGTGSACSSNKKNRYSRVILSCGLSEDIADGILRISFSPDNTLEEIKKAAEILNETVKNRAEKMS